MRQILKGISDALDRWFSKLYEGLDTNDPKVRQELIEMLFDAHWRYPIN